MLIWGKGANIDLDFHFVFLGEGANIDLDFYIVFERGANPHLDFDHSSPLQNLLTR